MKIISTQDITPAPPTILNIKVDINLLQGDAHAGAFDIGDHDKLGVCGCLVEVKLVLVGSIRNKAEGENQ